VVVVEPMTETTTVKMVVLVVVFPELIAIPVSNQEQGYLVKVLLVVQEF
jgi:hypothetical protein